MDSREEFVEGLRALASWYEKHNDIPVPDLEVTNYSMDTKEEAAKLVRKLGSCEKNYQQDMISITKKFRGITARFVFNRGGICTKKVIGVETIPAEFVEAFVRPARTREIVEWDCGPILSNDHEA